MERFQMCRNIDRHFVHLYRNEPRKMKILDNCTVKPALSGHSRGNLYCPFNTGVRLKEVLVPRPRIIDYPVSNITRACAPFV